MPTYEYACTSCGDHLEVVQSFKDEPLTTCPKCSGSLRKVYNPIGVVFKGSGFYKTDSRSSNGKSTATKDAPAPTTTSGGTDSSETAKSSSGDSSSKGSTSGSDSGGGAGSTSTDSSGKSKSNATKATAGAATGS